MVTSAQCLKKYGNPVLLKTQNEHMELWVVPEDIQKEFKHVIFIAAGTVGFPKKIFVNKDFKSILEKALRNVISRCLTNELKRWDGCFMIRSKVSNSSYSLHSWGIAIDINRDENDYGKKPKLTSEFVKCFTDAGCDWGGVWNPKDGMHFQISKI